jgi:hypothetical protein
MNRDDSPITPNQLGRIMHEFEKRGWNKTLGAYERDHTTPWRLERYETEREARLDILSRITGREITSVKELTIGEAGQVIGVLAHRES